MALPGPGRNQSFVRLRFYLWPCACCLGRGPEGGTTLLTSKIEILGGANNFSPKLANSDIFFTNFYPPSRGG